MTSTAAAGIRRRKRWCRRISTAATAPGTHEVMSSTPQRAELSTEDIHLAIGLDQLALNPESRRDRTSNASQSSFGQKGLISDALQPRVKLSRRAGEVLYPDSLGSHRLKALIYLQRLCVDLRELLRKPEKMRGDEIIELERRADRVDINHSVLDSMANRRRYGRDIPRARVVS
ncbi:hypothetical protein A6456_10535 [Paraburkholderia tropica]|nr:hypothetical protein A6456_10535 [Paraburkholderia tropica]